MARDYTEVRLKIAELPREGAASGRSPGSQRAAFTAAVRALGDPILERLNKEC